MTDPAGTLLTQTRIAHIVLGTTYQVQINRYGDGTLEYVAINGENKPKRTKAGVSIAKWARNLVDQLVLVT